MRTAIDNLLRTERE